MIGKSSAANLDGSPQMVNNFAGTRRSILDGQSFAYWTIPFCFPALVGQLG
jgi:hypothetical protein